MNKKIFIIFLFLIVSDRVLAKDYLCPLTPINATVGNFTLEHWLVWPERESKSFFNKMYYKYYPHSYKINYWVAFPSGNRIGDFNGPKHFIACCKLISKNSKSICAFKYVPESHCQPKLPSEDRVKFICDKNQK